MSTTNQPAGPAFCKAVTHQESRSCIVLRLEVNDNSRGASDSRLADGVGLPRLAGDVTLGSPNVPPYPPARYTKDEPEVSAWLRRGD